MIPLLASEIEGKNGKKFPYPSLIYVIHSSQKELKTPFEHLTKKMPLVTYRLVERAKAKGEKIEEVEADIATPATGPNVATRSSRPS